MDGQRFDGFARAMARRTSRRTILRGAAAGAAAGVLARGSASAGEPACSGDLVDCGSGCVDLQTDEANCGACGEICESTLVGVACIAGECVRTSCPAALPLQCGETVDDCVDPATDPNSCGACGAVCETGVCVAGTCGGCDEGEIVCGGICVATCCNNDNCGACGIVCTGGLTCFEGICDCPSGDCDGPVPSPSPSPSPPLTLPSTGAGATPTSGPDWTPAAIAAGALALGAAALRRVRPETRDV